MLETATKLVRDFFTVVLDMIYWLWRTLWGLNRGFVRSMMRRQNSSVHSIVTFLVVILEIVGLYVVAAGWAARH